MDNAQAIRESLLNMMSDVEMVKNYILSHFEETKFESLKDTKLSINNWYDYLSDSLDTIYTRAGVCKNAESDKTLEIAINNYAKIYLEKFNDTCDAVLKNLLDNEQN